MLVSFGPIPVIVVDPGQQGTVLRKDRMGLGQFLENLPCLLLVGLCPLGFVNPGQDSQVVGFACCSIGGSLPLPICGLHDRLEKRQSLTALLIVAVVHQQCQCQGTPGPGHLVGTFGILGMILLNDGCQLCFQVLELSGVKQVFHKLVCQRGIVRFSFLSGLVPLSRRVIPELGLLSVLAGLLVG